MRQCIKVVYATPNAAIVDIRKEYGKGNSKYPQSYYKCPTCGHYHLTTQQNLDNQILQMLADRIAELETKIDNQRKQLAFYEKHS